MVGGSSRIPKLKDLLRDYFEDDIQINDEVDPDVVVASGATIMAGILSGASDVDVTLNDVTPMTLGLAIQHEMDINFFIRLFKDNQFESLMEPMIPRNSQLPAEKVREFATVEDNQSKFVVTVLEGEEKKASDTHVLDTTEISLPPKPKGEAKVKVTFRINSDGIFTV